MRISPQRFTVAMAAVLVVVAGVVAVRSVVADDRTTGTVVVGARAPLSSPPAGTRWVGWGRVVVAVPNWWSTGETRCLAPVDDTVYFDTSAIADCADAPTTAAVEAVSALAVLDATSGYGESEVRSMQPVATVDGREVVERNDCEGWFDGVCRRLFAVPSEGVVFAVTIGQAGDKAGSETYQKIRDSVQILPTTHTVVPLASAGGWTPTRGADPRATQSLAAAIDNAGLRVAVRRAEPSDEREVGLRADLPEGSLLDVQPQLGSVIEKGGTVTLTVMGHDS